MTNAFTRTRGVIVAPSILSADFAHMASECAGVLAEGAQALHLDVMDGHFVPNLTMGPDMTRALRRAFPTTTLDVHLMIEHPGRFVDGFVEAGADHLTVHIEATGPAEARAIADDLHARGLTAGIAINPDTPVSAIEGLLDAFDLALVMSVHPGRSGQAFIDATLEKTRQISDLSRPNLRIQMDGGVGPSNAARVRDAGCDVLVAASAIFGKPAAERGGVIRELLGKPRDVALDGA